MIEDLVIAFGVVVGVLWHAMMTRTHIWLEEGGLTSNLKSYRLPAVCLFVAIRLLLWGGLLVASSEVGRSGYEILEATGMAAFYTGLLIGVPKAALYLTLGHKIDWYHRSRVLAWLFSRGLLVR